MFVKIINNDGEEIGCIKREFLVTLGLRHQIARVILYSLKTDSVLLQQRSLSRDTMPGAWDTSSSGHVDAHEEVVDGALRELREELGITAPYTALRYIGTYDTDEEFENGGALLRQTSVYVLPIDQDVDIEIDSSEVEGIEWVKVDELEQRSAMTRGARQAFAIFRDTYENRHT